jgi:hypothetical protein
VQAQACVFREARWKAAGDPLAVPFPRPSPTAARITHHPSEQPHDHDTKKADSRPRRQNLQCLLQVPSQPLLYDSLSCGRAQSLCYPLPAHAVLRSNQAATSTPRPPLKLPLLLPHRHELKWAGPYP